MQETTVQDAKAAAQSRTQLSLKQVELRDQLKELARRRNELQEQRQGTQPAQRAEIDGRIAVIDARTAQIESQLFATNDAIAGTFGGPVVSETDVRAKLAEAQAALESVQNDALRGAVSSAVDDAVFGAFAAATTTVLATIVLWRGFRRFVLKPKAPPGLRDNSAQIEKLQQSMDVIAIEVERISEAQRYTAKLLNERGLSAGEAQPVPANQREASRVR